MNDNLTTVSDAPYNLQYYQDKGGLSMAGNIRCSKCCKSMDAPVCKCGSMKCYIAVYWKEKHWKFWEYVKDGLPLDFERAKRQLNLIRSEIDSRAFNPVEWTHARISAMRFENKMREWINEKEAASENEELAYSTYETYRKYAAKYFYPLLIGTDIREINRERLQEFLYSLRQNKLSIKYRKCLLAALRSFFGWLWNQGAISDLPKFPEISGDDSPTVKVMLEYDEQESVLEHMPGPFRDPIEFMMETGLRTGEACALKVKDVYIEKRYAVIQRTWSGKKLRETTKARRKKPIPLSSRAMVILKDIMKGKFPEDLIFNMRPKTLQNAWSKYSGLQISLYEATRHSFCTQIVNMGVNTLQAKELMRHADIRSTEKYFHISVKKLCEIVEHRSKVIQFTRSVAEQKG